MKRIIGSFPFDRDAIYRRKNCCTKWERRDFKRDRQLKKLRREQQKNSWKASKQKAVEKSGGAVVKIKPYPIIYLIWKIITLSDSGKRKHLP